MMASGGDDGPAGGFKEGSGCWVDKLDRRRQLFHAFFFMLSLLAVGLALPVPALQALSKVNAWPARANARLPSRCHSVALISRPLTQPPNPAQNTAMPFCGAALTLNRALRCRRTR